MKSFKELSCQARWILWNRLLFKGFLCCWDSGINSNKTITKESDDQWMKHFTKTARTLLLTAVVVVVVVEKKEEKFQ